MGWYVATPRMKQCLLVGQSIIYLIAFASIYYQIPGLYGENGITPVAAKIEKCDPALPFNCPSPAILLISKHLSVRPSTAMQIIALLGILFSIITIAFKSTRFFFFYLILVLLYLSITKVGDVFLYFQWDSLILESGWLMVVLAGTRNSPGDVMSTYLVRFLAARLMFASGVVKLQSMCPTWWGLTAMDIHFESQCLPTPLSWFAHHSPEWMRRLSVALAFFIEIYLPPMFLLPIPTLRWLAGVPQIIFMGAIMLTGNYNFFNFHFALLAFSCLEGSYNVSDRPSIPRRLFNWFVSIVIFGAAIAHWVLMFGIKYDAKTSSILSKITFTKEEFAMMTKLATNIFVHLAIVGFVLAFFQCVIIARRSSTTQPETKTHDKKKHTFKKGNNKDKKPEVAKPVAVAQGGGIFGPTGRHAFFVLVFGSFLFWTSFVPFTNIDAAASNRIPDVLRKIHQSTSAFEFTHSYGLFRRMTGVEGRPEIVIEGSHQPNGPWKEIEFVAKPGDITQSPSFVLPHQPRLDWQMWFAALGAYQHNPFFVSLVNRLMNNDTNVIALLKNWPFANKKEPLKFVRAQLYHYRFTKPGDKNWWTRAKQHEYLPVMSKDAPAIIDFLSANNLLSVKKYIDGPVDKFIDQIHLQARQLQQTVFVWSTTGVAVLLALLV